MIKSENDYQIYPKEEEGEKVDLTKNHQFNLGLKVIQENEENYKKNEEENLSEEESLGYNSNYKVFKNNNGNKESYNIKELKLKRKASTLSTNISQNDNLSETNSFLPPNNSKTHNFERRASFTQPPHTFFGRERLNSTPVTSYFEGLDFYLRGLEPEKNEYKKTHNYIEKEIFFNERNIKESKFKSFDNAEQQIFNSNKVLKSLEDNCNKTTLDAKVSVSNKVENNLYNSINNNQNNYKQINSNFNTCIYGKFDMPMYYFRYYNFDCKLYYL
jgi:hypothetical protein